MKSKILKALETNARLSTSDLAKMLNVEEKEVIRVIGELEADKVICGYHTIINWDKASNEKVDALIELKVTPQRGTGFDAIANRIAKFDEVDSVFLLSGAYDFMVQIKGRSMKEVSQFVFDKLSTLDTVQSTATHFVLKKYKDHGIVLDERKIDKREKVIL